MYDVIIVGGGPAGLTAAIYAKRAGKNCLVIEKELTGGMINNSAYVENIPGFPAISGPGFSDLLTSQTEKVGVEIIYAEVTSILYPEIDDEFFVVTDGETYISKSVIIATGTKHNVLNLPGEEKLIGNGIHFCALCDGPFYKDKDVVVVGGGNSALTEALYLSNICKTVTILQNLPALTGDKVLIDRITATENIKVITNCSIVDYCVLNDVLSGVDYKIDPEGETIRSWCEGVFLCIGLSPNPDLTSGLLHYNDRGYITESALDGLYYAGDCSADTNVKQVVTACASGAIAGTSASNYIDSLR